MRDLWTAFDRLMGRAAPLGAEQVPLEEAVGRVAAREARATVAVPSFERSMMDGYLCHAADLAAATEEAPVALLVTGAVQMGIATAGGPGPGEAWTITTGGPLPPIGDQVVPVEMTRRDGGRVLVRGCPRATHRAAAGEDVRPGEPLLAGGQVVTSLAVLGLAAAGARTVAVVRRPRVWLLSTGDEVEDAGEGPLPEARVYNANGPALAADLRALGVEVTWGGIVRDDPEVLTTAFRTALDRGADVVISTGGVSVGPHDYVARCWRRLGAEPVVAGVDVKPGWPLYVGRAGERWAIGLSGSPAACLSTYNLLIRPLLLRLAGHRAVVRPLAPVRLEGSFSRPTDRTRLLWARVGGDGALPVARLCGGADVGKLTSIGQANALVIVPRGTPPLRGGEVLLALRLDQPESRETLATEAEARRGALAEDEVPAVCVVGYADAGKTTAVAGLLRALAERGIASVAVKHAAHGFSFDRAGSDSQHMAEAGAAAVWVSGPREVGARFFLDGELEPERLASLAAATAERLHGRRPRLVLLEGFSEAGLPRVVVGEARGAPDALVLGRLERGFADEDVARLADALMERLGLDSASGRAEILTIGEGAPAARATGAGV